MILEMRFLGLLFIAATLQAQELDEIKALSQYFPVPVQIKLGESNARGERVWKSTLSQEGKPVLKSVRISAFNAPAAIAELEILRILDEGGLPDQNSAELEKIRYSYELKALRHAIDRKMEAMKSKDFKLSTAEADYIQKRFGINNLLLFSEKPLSLYAVHYHLAQARAAAQNYNPSKMEFHLDSTKDLVKDNQFDLEVEAHAAPLRQNLADFLQAKKDIRDEDPDIRLKGIETLKNIAANGNPRALAPLIELLTDFHFSVSIALREAFQSLYEKGINMVPVLLEQAQSVNDESVIANLVASLGEKVVPDCIEALKHQNHFVRLAALETLSQFPTHIKDAVPELKRILQTDQREEREVASYLLFIIKASK